MIKYLQLSSCLRVWSFLNIWALTFTGENWIRRQVFSLQKHAKICLAHSRDCNSKSKFKFKKAGASKKCKKRPLPNWEVRLFKSHNKLLYKLDRVVFRFHFLPALLGKWCAVMIKKKILPFSPLFYDNPEKIIWFLSCGCFAYNTIFSQSKFDSRQNTERYDWICPVLSKAGWHIFSVDFPVPSSLWQWLTYKTALLKAKLPKEPSLSRILSCQEPV